MFAQPTVAALAVRIAEPPALADHALGPVIALAATDAAGPTPLFVLHPTGGIAWNYRALARALQPARPVYGLQSPALDARQRLPSSIEAMANDYVQRVVELQPTGAVHLLGWSVGGILAQAMAVRLHEIGRAVGELVLLDAYPSECWRAERSPMPSPHCGHCWRLPVMTRMRIRNWTAGNAFSRSCVVAEVRWVACRMSCWMAWCAP